MSQVMATLLHRKVACSPASPAQVRGKSQPKHCEADTSKHTTVLHAFQSVLWPEVTQGGAPVQLLFPTGIGTGSKRTV